MAWDPLVLRKYSTTSHSRLLNQVRGELKSQPLSRYQDGQINLGMSRRGGPYRVPADGPAANPSSRTGRSTSAPEKTDPSLSQSDANSFRDRLRAIEMR